MKKQIIILSLLFFNIIINANELVIEVTTDKYPNETTWTLFDTDRNVIKENGSLEKQTTYRDTVQLDASLCFYWTIYDTYGNGISDGTPPGDYKIYYDGVLVAECADPNFGDSISVYGLGSNCSAYDVSLESLTFNNTQSFTPFEITFELINFGSAEINSLDVVCSIDGTESEIILLDELNIEFGQKVELALPERLQIAEAGNYAIGFEILKINGQDDGNINNNSLTKNIEVKNGYWKTPMYELFTASTCPPCNPGNENFDGILELYDSNLYSLIKYQANFPGSGDPYYTNHVGRMIQSYSISAVPTLNANLDKSNPNDFTVSNFESYLGLLTDVSIKTEAKAIGDSIFVDLNIISAITQNSDLFIRMAVVEKTTYDNVGTNGETEFHNVFMKFLSEWDGDNIGVLEAGKEVSLSYAESMTRTFVEEMNDLRVVAYVYKLNSYKILQSEMVEVPFSSAPPYISFNIENGAVGIDTLSTIEMISDKPLENIDGTEITDVSSIVSFSINDGSGVPITFTGTISDDKKTVTIIPDNSLKANTSFKVGLHSVQSNDGVEVGDTEISFTTVNVVGINDNTFDDFNVFPNPADQFIRIVTDNNCEISIMDITGKTIYKQNALFGETVIDITGINSGLYILKCEIYGESKSIKFQKIN